MSTKLKTYRYTGEQVGTIPGVGAANPKVPVTARDAEHARAIEATGLYEALPDAEAKKVQAAEAEATDTTKGGKK